MLCLAAAGGPFADLRFLAKEDVLGSPWRDGAVTKPSFCMSAAGVDGLPLGIYAWNVS